MKMVKDRLAQAAELRRLAQQRQPEQGTGAIRPETGLKRYTDLSDLAPVGYFTLDRRGTILQVNIAGAGLVGVERSRLANRRLDRFLSEETRPAFKSFLKKVFEGQTQEDCKVELLTEKNESLIVQIKATACEDRRQCRAVLIDISEHDLELRRKSLALWVLDYLNVSGANPEALREILKRIKDFAGMEAAAIRLREGDDFPYAVQIGFPEQFVETETSLSARSQTGRLMLDSRGHPILECMCGLVLVGRADPSKPFFTEGGSFWTNSTTDLLADTSEAERTIRTRNRCHRHGYESVALVPIRVGSELLGLLQLNDSRRGRLGPEIVRFLEGIVASIGVSLWQKRTAEALRREKEFSDRLIGGSLDGIMAFDRECRYVVWNPGMERITGIPRADAIGRRASDVLAFLQETGEDQSLIRVLNGETVDAKDRPYFIPFTGREGFYEANYSPIRDESGIVVGGLAIVRDITVHKKTEQAIRKARDELETKVGERTAELSEAYAKLHEEVRNRMAVELSLRERSDQLRALASQLTLAEQRERHRLAKVLHDYLQQLLVAAHLMIDPLDRAENEGVRDSAAKVRDLIRQSLEASRSLTGELSPPRLYQGGLTPALNWLLRWMQENLALDVNLELVGRDAPLTVDLTILIFQAVRELLFNVVKHAKAKSARVQLVERDDQLEVIVADDGVGFDLTHLRPEEQMSGDFGLFSIRERLGYLGGRMEIVSSPGQGSRVSLHIPVRRCAARETRQPASGNGADPAAH